MNHRYSFSQDPVGCGLSGCLGGLILGLFGGGVLLVLAALVAATTAPLPAPTPNPQPGPDLRVTITESFLNRFAEQPAEGSVSIDILPNNQVQLIADTSLEAFGLTTPVQITGLFELQLTPQTLQVQLLETQVSGLSLPPELADFFSEDILLVNQDLSSMVNDISNVLGTPVILSNLSTTDTQIQLEIKEAP